MKRRAARGALWRETWGIALTVVSAVLLAIVLWQISQTSKEAPLDRAALQRERAVVSETDQFLKLIDVTEAYRYALVLDRPNRAALANDVRRVASGIDTDFQTGSASLLDLSGKWSTVRGRLYEGLSVRPGPRAYDSTKFDTGIVNFLSAMQDASNLTYDPSLIAQNLANAFTQETPYALVATARLRTLIDLSEKNHGMTLARRMTTANSVYNLRLSSDISGDNFPLVAKMMSELIPQARDRWRDLPGLAQKMNEAGLHFADLTSQHALLESAGPSLRPSAFSDAAAAYDRAVLAMHVAAGVALDASLAKRGEIQEQRDRLVYIAFVLGAMLLAGSMVAIAQLAARRDRAMLRLAQDESLRLQTELARQRAEQALRLSEAQFRAVFEGAAVGIAVIDRTGTLLEANGVFRAMFGESISSALGGHEVEVMALFAGEHDTFEFEQNIRLPSGEIWTDATVSIVNDERDHPHFAVCMFRDKTALKHSERRQQYDKTHDALTGLPNRQLFEEHLRTRFAENGLLDSFFAVLIVELEHFKEINESMGHATGDLVLTQVAGRLRSAIDPRDVVARPGGDDFAVLIQSLGDILHVESVVRRILNAVGRPVTIGEKSIYVGAHVGIAIGSTNYKNADDVMRDAEVAAQHARNAGGTRYAVFDSKMQARAQKRLELTSDLRQAIERSEFRVLYQPIVSLQDAQLVGCEALIRWDHPVDGVINPMDFIPLAEKAGLASAIGRLVLQSSAEQLAAWRRNRGGSLEFRMNVNISASELNNPDFERTLVQLIEHHGLAPSDLTLEITENVVLDAQTRANVTLERLHDRGFGICIDDFGTGYSSLRYLQQFKVDTIKIDRSFVAGAEGGLASEPIVRTLMTLAEAYDVRVVAEGIETTRQRDMLRSVGCRLGQGFLFSRPLSASEIVEKYPEVLGRIGRSASA